MAGGPLGRPAGAAVHALRWGAGNPSGTKEEEPEMTAQTVNPFAALADPSGDYELTVRVSVDFQDYSAGVPSALGAHGEFVVDAGREGGLWRLRTYEKLGEDGRGLDV